MTDFQFLEWLAGFQGALRLIETEDMTIEGVDRGDTDGLVRDGEEVPGD